MWLLFADQVAQRDDANGLTILYHWQAPNGLIAHQTDRVIDRV